VNGRIWGACSEIIVVSLVAALMRTKSWVIGLLTSDFVYSRVGEWWPGQLHVEPLSITLVETTTWPDGMSITGIVVLHGFQHRASFHNILGDKR
jgi:hypothetical protein